MDSKILAKAFGKLSSILGAAWMVLIGWRLVQSPETSWWVSRIIAILQSYGIGLGLLIAALGLGVWAGRSRLSFGIHVMVAGFLIFGCILLVTSQQAGAAFVVLWWTLVAWLVGFAVLRFLKIALDPFSALVLSVTLGLGILALVTLAIGLAGLLDRGWVYALSVFTALTLIGLLHQEIRQWMKKAIGEYRNYQPEILASICFTAFASFAIINWVGALAPEIMFDALKSHLALAKIYATSHQVTGLPYSIGSYWPMNGEMLFSLGFLTGGETAAKLFHFLAGILTTGIVYSAGKYLGSPLIGWVSAMIFYTTPIIGWESTTAYVDLFLAMYAGAAVLLLIRWLNVERTWQVAAAVGLFLGFAIGVKPTGGYIALAIGLVMLYTLSRDYPKLDWKNLRDFILTTSVTALFGGIWYLRAFLLTGNPVFPFLNGIFQSPLWYPLNESFNYESFGVGRSLPALVSLPWELTFESSRFGEVANGALGMLYLAPLPFGLLTLKRGRRLGPLAFIALFFGALWIFSAQYVRYLIPALIPLSILSGWIAVSLWDVLRERSSRLASFVPVILALFSMLNIPLTLIQFRYSIPTLVPYDVVLGRISRDAYLAQRVPSNKAYTYVNHFLGKDDFIYGVGEYFQYLSDLPMLTPFFSVKGDQILTAQDPHRVRDLLNQAGITYLLINTGQTTYNHWSQVVHSASFLKDNAIMVFSSNDVVLYRLVPQGSNGSTAAPNLLLNSGFEELDSRGNLSQWSSFGNVAVDRTGSRSRSGQAVVQAQSGGGFYQLVSVKPGQLYTLGHWARADRPGQSARLQINWLDDKRQIVDFAIHLIPVSATWEWHQMSVNAPERVTFAQVYANVQGQSEIWFDDMSFVEGQGN